MRSVFWTAALAIFVVAGCGKQPAKVRQSDADFHKKLQLQLIAAKAGEVIELPAGKWTFNRSLSLNKSNVTIRGAGPDKTVLSFKGQVQGAEGLLINAAEHVTIENLAIEDTKGDGLKANGCKDLTIRNVRVEWTGGPDEKNGAYGVYPVQCERVLIEKSTVIGASDAGIYVGQSTQDRRARQPRRVQRRRHRDREHARTPMCIATPPPTTPAASSSSTCRACRSRTGARRACISNHIHDNNTDNFAPKGNIVATVPTGTGFMVLANDEVEFFDNKRREQPHRERADPVVRHDRQAGERRRVRSVSAEHLDPRQQFAGGGDSPDQLELKAMKVAKFGLTGNLPDILWDGAVAKDMRRCSHEDLHSTATAMRTSPTSTTPASSRSSAPT